MKATVIIFPGDGKPREANIDGDTATLRQVLEQTQAMRGEGEKADLTVNGVVTDDLEMAIPNGAIVTKTKRVDGG